MHVRLDTAATGMFSSLPDDSPHTEMPVTSNCPSVCVVVVVRTGARVQRLCRGGLLSVVDAAPLLRDWSRSESVPRASCMAMGVVHSKKRAKKNSVAGN